MTTKPRSGLKKRIVGVLVVKSGIVVQSIGFQRFLPVGVPEVAVEYLNRWGIDEIIVLDIDATPERRGPALDLLRRCSSLSQAPMTYGGGISEVGQIESVIQAGFEKVALNTALVDSPSLLTEGAHRFGNQSIVASIDAREVKGKAGVYEAFVACGKRRAGHTPAELARKAQELGAGEILLTSIDRNGSKRGYDLALIETVRAAVSIPVIVAGGVDHPRHFAEAIAHGVSAAAAGNFFHYTEHSVICAKHALVTEGAPVRLDTYTTYEGFEHDEKGRATKRDDDYLDKLRFTYVPEEKI